MVSQTDRLVQPGRFAARIDRPEQRLKAVLGRALVQLESGAGADAVRTVTLGLERIRRSVADDRWEDELIPLCREHPTAKLFSEDPYTHRALAKPRGFAGDAVMLDFVYDGIPPKGVTELGRAVFRGTVSSPSGRSVVDRRDRLAKLIQDTCAASDGARILSVASGHLREAQSAGGLSHSQFAEFHALDQDPEALKVVDAGFASIGVRTRCGSVREIISGRIEFERLDLVYAAGLLDYLSDAVAGRLIARLATFLAPGGRLLVGNFTPSNWGRSYMDAFMDWRLIYRTGAELRDLARAAGATRQMALEQVSVDSLGNIAYLELARPA